MEPDYFSKHTMSGPTVGLTYFTYWTPETVRKITVQKVTSSQAPQ